MPPLGMPKTRRRTLEHLDLTGDYHEHVVHDAPYKLACYQLQDYGGGYAIHVTTWRHRGLPGLLLLLRNRPLTVERYTGEQVAEVQARHPSAPKVSAYKLPMPHRHVVDEQARAWLTEESA